MTVGMTPAEIVAPVLARQGHLYQYGQAHVLALQSGETVDVVEISDGSPWLGSRSRVSATALRPLPMRYYRDETPR